ncbi:MAG: calcium-binding protein [Aureliella sp.]
MAKRHNNFRRMMMEGLETRKLMAVDIVSSGDLVEFRGNDEANSVIVTESDGHLHFETDQGTFIRLSDSVNKIRFFGGDGNDVFENHSSIAAEAYGDLGNDQLLGGSSNDVLDGGKGDDVMEGRGGDDKLIGANGDDTYVFSGGGLGYDKVVDLAHENTLDFSRMDSRVKVSLRNPYKQTINGDLQLKLGRDDAVDHVIGSSYNDRIIGNNLANNIDAGEGNDEILGYGGSDVINGGKGDDILQGDRGDDVLIGGNGDDTYRFRNSGLGSDTIHDLAHENTLDFYGIGGGGIRISLSNPYMQEVNENLSLKLSRADAIDHVYGTDAGDTIIGNALDNRLHGFKGNDSILGKGGADMLDGGKGADELFGGSGPDQLFGASGEDKLYGESGDDYLHGGAMTDHLYGGSGADEFRTNDGDVDWIFFDSREDTFRGKDDKDELWDEYNPIHESPESEDSATADDTSSNSGEQSSSDGVPDSGALELPAGVEIPEELEPVNITEGTSTMPTLEDSGALYIE